jgi:hypothetical protein
MAGVSNYLLESSAGDVNTALGGTFGTLASSGHYQRLSVSTLSIDTEYTDTTGATQSWTMADFIPSTVARDEIGVPTSPVAVIYG